MDGNGFLILLEQSLNKKTMQRVVAPCSSAPNHCLCVCVLHACTSFGIVELSLRLHSNAYGYESCFVSMPTFPAQKKLFFLYNLRFETYNPGPAPTSIPPFPLILLYYTLTISPKKILHLQLGRQGNYENCGRLLFIPILSLLSFIFLEYKTCSFLKSDNCSVQ